IPPRLVSCWGFHPSAPEPQPTFPGKLNSTFVIFFRKIQQRWGTARPWHSFLTQLSKFFSRSTERFVNGVDVLVETLWRLWTDLLDVLGIDASNLTHYFSPAAVANNPTRALLLVGAVLLAYWFLSLFLGFLFYLLHVLFGRFFWVVRVTLFALSCVYILQKYEGEPEQAVLPLCLVVAIYFMTGPVGFYWRSGGTTGGGGSSNLSLGSHSLEEKIDHLDSQIRLLNIRLSRVLEGIDRDSDK
uniref:BRI3 binding protein n=1 Tax=Sarcophilus harrisii TaxID=9305 RepID=A0A7N4PH71_SARHA